MISPGYERKATLARILKNRDNGIIDDTEAIQLILKEGLSQEDADSLVGKTKIVVKVELNMTAGEVAKLRDIAGRRALTLEQYLETLLIKRLQTIDEEEP